MKYEVIINDKYSIKVDVDTKEEAYEKVSSMEGWEDTIIFAEVRPIKRYIKLNHKAFDLFKKVGEVR